MTTNQHPVTDFLFRGEEPVPRVDLPTGAGAAGYLRGLSGQFALHQRCPDGWHVLCRDRLGVNKLFFAITGDGDVRSANFWIDLVRAGHPAHEVWSVPAGHVLRVAPGQRALALQRYAQLAPADEANGASKEDLVARIRACLGQTFRALLPVAAGRPLYVTLSGGLDSTTIAVLAREHLPDFTAVTFAIDDGSGESEDLRSARKVAEALSVPLRVVRATPDQLVALLDLVLLYGQDFRDFNVHSGLVNAAIGAALRKGAEPEGPRPLLLTGDTMNELMADYTEEAYRGKVYYALPRLPAGRLRRYLVQGLDAGDREVGIFTRFGIDTLQPYALCADAYLAWPGAWLERPGAKQELVRLVMGDRVPPHVYERPKVRAQLGGGGGTLAALVDRGIDAGRLMARFAALFDIDPAALTGCIRAGRYRFPARYPDGDTDERQPE